MPKTGFREAFLHYIWQYQYFDKTNLSTTSGESIQILSPGFVNKNAGPDFYNCRLFIQNIEWHGTVEIHYKTSDWTKHKHSTDSAYNNVVLHLVWEADQNPERADGTKIPTIELKNRIEKKLIEKYKNLIETSETVPCGNQITDIDPIYIHSMLERVLVERMENKASEILQLLNTNKNDWEETCYQWLGKCFGFKINSDPFQRLCTYLPFHILKKYLHSPIQTESLLFGIAGFLDSKSNDIYFINLKNEFDFLQQKHSLNNCLKSSDWNFLRLRPSNFPTLRIAQFAAFLNKNKSLYDFVFQDNQVSEALKKGISNKPNDYWPEHYHFEKPSKREHESKMGLDSIENLIVNAIVPLRFAHTLYYDKIEERDSILELLKELKPDKNSKLEIFERVGLQIKNAHQSQSYLQLFNEFCTKKDCLSCTIGHQIIYPNSRA